MGMVTKERSEDLAVLLRPSINAMWEETKTNIETLCRIFRIPEASSPLACIEGMVILAYRDGHQQANKEVNDDFKAHMAELIKGLKE
tara:strand:+ start:2760 stop:3020 length:261 start_codon:yes stop_codon:yes gene_type:complete